MATSANCRDEVRHLLIKGSTIKPGIKPEQRVLAVAHLTRNGGESASMPLVDFDVLNDNLIKCLISFVKCISRF
jgi:hypothetical protein